jgi:hypothetical protein
MRALATTDLAEAPLAAVEPPPPRRRHRGCLAAGRRHLGHGRGGCRRVGPRRVRRHRRGCSYGGSAEVAAALIAAAKAAMSITATPPARQR